MRMVRALLLAGAASVWSGSAVAADALKFGPAPAWVHAQTLPAAKATQAPVQLLLDDEQISLEPGKITSYREGAMRIENSQGLAAAGNLSVVWQPETETVTVNKLQIIRGGKAIDVLAGGQTFTVLRRETNLDAATLDGTLTATIQPEGLQQGDVLVLATTTVRSDPVMKGHVESVFGGWGGLPIALAHASVRWPTSLHLDVRQTPNLPAAQRSTAGGFTTIDLVGRDVQPLVSPKAAPDRFKIGRLAEATDFRSWSDLADLMAPLYRTAEAIPASGALHDQVETIRSASPDPKTRATQALALVQDRVRYVALLMGEGGYVPASAEQTWSRRFGDCKAKTALLLGILHSLGIAAEPVLVQASVGDMVADRLPMIRLFNHVLVRAHVGGKDYWLDGTRTGDTDLDAITIPDFGWALPVVEHAALVHLVPKPYDVPRLQRHVTVDASRGIFTEAPITIEEIYRGDSAVDMNQAYSALSADQRDEAMRGKAKDYFDGFTMASSSADFDKTKQVFALTIKGTAKISWKDGWFDIPTSNMSYDPDFDRPAGPMHDVPIAVNYPRFIKDQATIRLPPGFAAAQKLSAPVHETLAGVEYSRSETVAGDVLTVDSSERAITPEVAYKDARAAESRLRSLNKDDVYLNSSVAYTPTKNDLAAVADQAPSTADEFVTRGNLYLNSGKYDEAIADYSEALNRDPTNAWALADRGLAHAWKHEIPEAEKDLAAAEKQDSRNSVALRARGLMAEFKEDCATAVDYFTRSLASEPGNSFALGHRAICEASLRKDADALSDSAQALKVDPQWSALRIVRSEVFVRQGKTAEAAAEADSIVAAMPNNGFGLVAAANIYMRADDRKRALATLEKTAALPDQSEQLMIARAELYRQLDKNDDAIRVTDDALKAHYKSPELRLLRANLFMQGKRDLMAGEAEAAMRDNPKSNDAFVSAARILAAAGQTDKALKAFDGAIAIKPEAYIYINRAQVRPRSDVKGRLADIALALKLAPEDPDALAEKARLLEQTGDYTGALAALDTIKSDSPDPYTRAQRAVILYKAGRTEESRKAFDALHAEAKTSVEFNNLCWAKATEDLFLDSALEDCRAALKLSPGTGSFEDSLGMVLLKLGKLDEALTAYNAAVASKTGAASLMGRAFVYLRKGDRAHAEADAAAARKLAPKIDDTFAGYGLTFDTPAPVKAQRTASK